MGTKVTISNQNDLILMEFSTCTVKFELLFIRGYEVYYCKDTQMNGYEDFMTHSFL